MIINLNLNIGLFLYELMVIKIYNILESSLLFHDVNFIYGKLQLIKKTFCFIFFAWHSYNIKIQLLNESILNGSPTHLGDRF